MTILLNSSKIMRCSSIILVIIVGVCLANCASYDFSRRLVRQGNLLPQATIARLHLGMSKENVAILMGTSLLSSTFNDDRWDYAYTSRHGNSELMIKWVSLYFHGGVLTQIVKKDRDLNS